MTDTPASAETLRQELNTARAELRAMFGNSSNLRRKFELRAVIERLEQQVVMAEKTEQTARNRRAGAERAKATRERRKNWLKAY